MLTTAYYFLQVVLCSAVMMGYYWLVLRNNRFHQYNRFYLLGIGLLSWIVPLIKIRWNHPAVSQDAQMIQFLSVVADNNSQIDESLTNNGFHWNLDTTATLVYTAVSGILLVGMLLAFFRIYQLLRKHSCKNVGDVYLILTSAKGTPFSFFRYIFWNEEIDIRSEAGKQILQHELTHVQQKHSIDKIAIQIMLIIGWFNPFFWLLKKEMEMIHEFIADKKAVNNGDSVSLAQMLLAAAYPQQQFALTHPFFFSPIKRRLQMLTNHKNPRFSYIRRLVILPLMAIVVVLFAFRNKEQRAHATVSVASVVENVVDGISKKIPGVNKPEPITHSPESDTTIIKTDKITIRSGGESVEIDGKVHVNANKFKNALIILDGKKTDNTILETLNPNVIESVNILKGESAIALYGDVGKNGIVIITTKQYAVSQGQSLNNNQQKNLAAAQSNLQVTQGNLNENLSLINISGNKNNSKSPDTSILLKDKAGNKLNPQPLVFIDGVKGDMNSISPDQIKRVDVLKSDSLILKYGDEGKNGVVLITTKNAHTPSDADTKISPASIIGYRDKENAEVNNFLKRNPSVKDVYWWAHTSFKMQIELKDGTEETYDLVNPESKKRAEAKYGKLPVPPSPPPPHVLREGFKIEPEKKETDNKIFAVAQTPAEFPGGQSAWLKYLQRNLNLDLPVEKGAPPGKYTVVVSFIVDKEGNLSEVKAENDPGFGTKAEAVRIIVKGPKWTPAMQNGKNVIYRVKQNVTWVISEPDVNIKTDNEHKTESNKKSNADANNKTALQKDYENKLAKAKANNLKTFFTINNKSCVITDKGSWAEIAGTTNIVIVNGKRTSPEELNSKFKRTDFVLVAASATGETIEKYGKGVLLVSSKPLTPKEVSSFLE